MTKLATCAPFGRRIHAFSSLLSEATGLSNKVDLCRYLLSRVASVRAIECSDRILDLRCANVCFGARAGELYSYIEVFLQDDYGLAQVASKGVAGVILDVGANIGMFSIAASRICRARVYAFEPNPVPYARLLRNLEANRVSNVTPINRAVYSRSGAIKFSAPGSTTTGRVSENGSLLVNAVTVDEVQSQEQIERVCTLKIDVEGAEVEVLRGATRTLGITEWLLIECHGRALVDDVERIARAHGFTKVSERRWAAGGGGVLRFRKSPTGARSAGGADMM